MQKLNPVRTVLAAEFFAKCRSSRAHVSWPVRPARLRSHKVTVRHAHSPADNASFTSIVDNPPNLVKVGKAHSKLGIAVLAVIPFTAFLLGTWQVYRLDWKTKLIAKLEDRLVRPPLPLPPRIDPEAVSEFDYRRVYARGVLRHDQEMLIGPRLRDGTDGYLVVTPLERDDGTGDKTTVLVNRGWISKDMFEQRARDAQTALPQGEVLIQGLLREPFKKNVFTPDNKPEEGKFYFPDVRQMAELSRSQPVWIEETMAPDLLVAYDREAKGIPIGRPAEVNLRNNHFQYIFTWYSLSAITSVMMYMVLKKKPADVARRVRRNTSW